MATLHLRQELASRVPLEPLSKIVWTASQMPPDQPLKVIAPFEPVLLTQVLAARGFTARSTSKTAPEWEVVFAAKQPTAEGDAETEPAAAGTQASPLGLDFRGAASATSGQNHRGAAGIAGPTQSRAADQCRAFE